MTPNVFVDAFSAIDSIFGELTPKEQIEARYYNILCDISIALVEYRIAHNLNQKQLADVLGVAQSMVSKYESGDYNISVRALNELCGKLNIPFDVSIGKPEPAAAAAPSEESNMLYFMTGDEAAA